MDQAYAVSRVWRAQLDPPADDICETNVLMTMVGGKIVYRR